MPSSTRVPDAVAYLVTLAVVAVGIYALYLLFAKPVSEHKAFKFTITTPCPEFRIRWNTVALKATFPYKTQAQEEMNAQQQEKEHAAEMSKLQKELDEVQGEIDGLEDELVDYVRDEEIEVLE